MSKYNEPPKASDCDILQLELDDPLLKRELPRKYRDILSIQSHIKKKKIITILLFKSILHLNLLIIIIIIIIL